MIEETFFDAVLTKDMTPLFNGTPEETKEWIWNRMEFLQENQVCIGKTLKTVSIGEYMDGYVPKY